MKARNWKEDKQPRGCVCRLRGTSGDSEKISMRSRLYAHEGLETRLLLHEGILMLLGHGLEDDAFDMRFKPPNL